MDLIDLPSILTCTMKFLEQNLLISGMLCAVLVLGMQWFVSSKKVIEKEAKRQRKDSEVSEVTGDMESEDYEFIPLDFKRIPESDMKVKVRRFYEDVKSRRSCRHFSKDDVSKEIVENIIRVAGTAPSGANLQPWFYVVVSNADVKAQLRDIIEEEEEINYRRRMGKDWVEDLKKFKTNWIKPYLTEAPHIILLFREESGFREDKTKQTNYYKELSSAISAGFLLMAIHQAGLSTVTTTPLNCGPRIRHLLQRPSNEKLILLFPIGYPADDAMVPNVSKKPLHKIMLQI